MEESLLKRIKMIDLKITKNNIKEVEDYVLFNLHRFNQKHNDYIRNNSSDNHNNKINGNFAVYVNGKIIGGALGYIKYGWYFLNDFYIEEEYRGHGIGTQIIKEIEQFALDNKALGVRVESWDFQDPKFYQKLGYVILSEFKDCPLGTVCYSLYKKFGD